MTPHVIDKYLKKFALVPAGCPELDEKWQHVMVVPCFDESSDFIWALQERLAHASLLLVIVINRPASISTNVNQAIKSFLFNMPTQFLQAGYSLHRLSSFSSALCIDLESLEGPTPNKQGVGRARRVGCDVALTLIRRKTIASRWICSSDADADWPISLFELTWPSTASAVSIPFSHRLTDNDTLSMATLVYELKLHHYVLHLQSIGSAYAFHALGSSCALNSSAYAAVRGVPLRSAAEDFYLLNKLAKIGPVYRPTGIGVTIASRLSNRVPFGTGPSVGKLLNANDACEEPLFYDAKCFLVLRKLLNLFSNWINQPASDTRKQLANVLGSPLGDDLHQLLSNWNYEKAVRHIYNAGKTDTLRKHHSNIWFDGFKLLKVIHLTRDKHYPNLTLNQSMRARDQWPVEHTGTPANLRHEIYRKLNWTL